MFKYKLLSGSSADGLFSQFVPDPEVSLRTIDHGATVNGVLVNSLDTAAKVFGDILAEMEYGENARACSVRRDCDVATGAIFEMMPGTPSATGGYVLETERRFAVTLSGK
jgi:hypothetical protein